MGVMMIHRIFIPGLVALTLLIHGAAAWATQDQATLPSQKAQAMVQDMTRQAVATLTDSSLNDDERGARIRRLILSFVDLDRIAKFVLPRRWETATPDQQAAFLKTFEDTQVLIWNRRFRSSAGQAIEVKEVQQEADGTWLVDTNLVSPSAPPIGVQWRVRLEDDGTAKITDVVVKGISMALAIRDDLVSILQANGQNFDALLSTLKARNSAMLNRTAQARTPLPDSISKQ